MVEPRNNVAMPEEEQSIPKANMMRIMRRIIPRNVKVSDEAKEAVQLCVTEFVGFITSEANERCRKEHRKILTVEDILWAMDTLGFDDYVQPLILYLKRYRQNEAETLGNLRGGDHVAGYSMLPRPPPHPYVASYPMLLNFPTGVVDVPNMYQGMFNSISMDGLHNDGSGSSGSGVGNVGGDASIAAGAGDASGAGGSGVAGDVGVTNLDLLTIHKPAP